MSDRVTSWYVRVALAYLRWWKSEVVWAAQTIGYWVRPYDMLADRRRWRWQPVQRCGLPAYILPMEPVFPCREMPTRHCPAVYGAVCGDRPCARYESNDESLWYPEIRAIRETRSYNDPGGLA